MYFQATLLMCLDKERYYICICIVYNRNPRKINGHYHLILKPHIARRSHPPQPSNRVETSDPSPPSNASPTPDPSPPPQEPALSSLPRPRAEISSNQPQAQSSSSPEQVNVPPSTVNLAAPPQPILPRTLKANARRICRVRSASADLSTEDEPLLSGSFVIHRTPRLRSSLLHP